MQRLAAVILAILGAGLILWGAGVFEALRGAILAAQRAAQTELAAAVRALRAGEAGALAGFLALCFGYGLLHAAGPGHGKLVIGGYGAAARVTAARLVGLSVLASLLQAAVAVALVYTGVALLGITRQAAAGLAERVMAPLGSAAIAGLGLYLMLRGWRHWQAARRHRPEAGHHHHDHHDHHGPECGCGHAHGPSAEEVARLHGWRDTAALLTGIALRPCTGAVFVLILTWQLGIGGAGIAGAFGMGLGTAALTGGVAVLTVFARESALSRLSLPQAARVLPLFEIGAGALVAALSLAMLARAL